MYETDLEHFAGYWPSIDEAKQVVARIAAIDEELKALVTPVLHTLKLQAENLIRRKEEEEEEADDLD